MTKCDLRHSLFAPMVSIRFFCLVRPKIQHPRSGTGSESGTFGPLGKKIFFIISKLMYNEYMKDSNFIPFLMII